MEGIVGCSAATCSVRELLCKLLHPACLSSQVECPNTCPLVTTNSTLAYCDVPQRDNSLVLEIITGVFGGLAFIFVVLRMLTRVRPFKAGFGWDDGLILAVTVRLLRCTLRLSTNRG